MKKSDKLIARPETIIKAIEAVKRAPFPIGNNDVTSRQEWQTEQKQALIKLTKLLFNNQIG